MLLEGPPGCGKTELLTRVTDRATRTGMLVLTAACTIAERDLPFGVLNQLLLSASLADETNDRVERLLTTDLLSISPDDGPSDPSNQHMARAYHELCVVLLQLTRDAPVVLVIDDFGHADAQSLSFLLYLARRIMTARMLVVLTDGTSVERLECSFQVDLLRQPHLRQLRLAPLSKDGVVALLAERLDDEAAAHRLSADFHAASGGNPHLLSSLIDDHLAEGQVRAHGYGHAVQSCLYRHGPTAVRVAQAVAILDDHEAYDDGAPTDLACIAELDIGVVSRVLHAMALSGLLDDGRFRHPVGRAAVLDTMPAARRSELHHRAAQRFHNLGRPALTVAHHLAEADRRGVPWAAPVLCEAAKQSLLRDDARLAVCYLELARHSSASAPERAAIRATLAATEWRSNTLAAVPHLVALVADVTGGHLSDHDAATVARRLLWHGHTDESATVLSQLRQHPDDEPRAAQGSALHDAEAWLSFCHPPLAGRRRSPATMAQRQNVLATTGTDYWLGVAAYFSDVLARGGSRQAAQSVEQVLKAFRLRDETCWEEESATLALQVLLQADKPEIAMRHCDLLLLAVRTRRAPTWQAIFRSMRAEAALRQGDLLTAAADAREALVLVPPKAWGTALGFPLGTLVLASIRSGNDEEADRCLTYAVPEAMFESRYGLHYLHARGHHHLAANRLYAALTDFLRCGELIRNWGLDAAELVPWRTSAAQTWLCLGNRDQARQLVQEQLGRPGPIGPRSRALSLRMLAAISAIDRRPHLLGEALDLFEDSGDHYEQALVLRDLSYAYSGLGKSRRARLVLRRARHLAALCAAAPLCEELLAAPDADAPAIEPHGQVPAALLTDSERRIAQLAVRGYTNREIAAKLYITASTVEQHLTRVYRKLKVQGRKDLPTDLNTTADEPQVPKVHHRQDANSPCIVEA